MRLGKDFQPFTVPVNTRVNIRGWQAGSGPALLLLHGFPQCHLIWHKVAEQLSQHYTVIAPDLRGYGSSSKPEADDKHKEYSKSTMAHDIFVVMKHLGHAKYYVCGHDRGGRVAHKLCVDYPDHVLKVMFLDIAPTLAMYEATNQLFATAYWHWFFLIQPSPFPEDLISAHPEVMLKKCIRGPSSVFHPDAMAAYEAMFKDKRCVHAMCEDYRAGATIDLEEQRDDIQKGRKIKCDVKVYWGQEGLIEKMFNAVDEWANVATGQVSGGMIDCGHYIPEEAPDVLGQCILEFFC